MKYTKLLQVREDKELNLKHFPSRFHAAVFRLWETVDAKRIAEAIGTDLVSVQNAAADMGLPAQKYTEKWDKLGYITTIRNAWHTFDNAITASTVCSPARTSILTGQFVSGHGA